MSVSLICRTYRYGGQVGRTRVTPSVAGHLYVEHGSSLVRLSAGSVPLSLIFLSLCFDHFFPLSQALLNGVMFHYAFLEQVYLLCYYGIGGFCFVLFCFLLCASIFCIPYFLKIKL